MVFQGVVCSELLLVGPAQWIVAPRNAADGTSVSRMYSLQNGSTRVDGVEQKGNVETRPERYKKKCQRHIGAGLPQRSDEWGPPSPSAKQKRRRVLGDRDRGAGGSRSRGVARDGGTAREKGG